MIPYTDRDQPRTADCTALEKSLSVESAQKNTASGYVSIWTPHIFTQNVCQKGPPRSCKKADCWSTMLRVNIFPLTANPSSQGDCLDIEHREKQHLPQKSNPSSPGDCLRVDHTPQNNLHIETRLDSLQVQQVSQQSTTLKHHQARTLSHT